MPLDPKRKSLRCQPEGSTRPYTYTVKDREGKTVKDENGEIVYETIQVAMNRRERRKAAPSFKVWKKMKVWEAGMKIMQAKMDEMKAKKEAKEAKAKTKKEAKAKTKEAKTKKEAKVKA